MNLKGGIEYYDDLSNQKSELLYNFLERSDGYYHCAV